MRTARIFYYLTTLICIGLFHLLPKFLLLSAAETECYFLLFFFVAISGFIFGIYWKDDILISMATYFLFMLLYISTLSVIPYMKSLFDP